MNKKKEEPRKPPAKKTEPKAAKRSGELDDQELDQVSGGTLNSGNVSPAGTKNKSGSGSGF